MNSKGADQTARMRKLVCAFVVCIPRWQNSSRTFSKSRVAGFYTKLNVWGSLGLNFEYDGGPIIEIGGPIFLYKLRILEGSTSFREGSVLSPGQ